MIIWLSLSVGYKGKAGLPSNREEVFIKLNAETCKSIVYNIHHYFICHVLEFLPPIIHNSKSFPKSGIDIKIIATWQVEDPENFILQSSLLQIGCRATFSYWVCTFIFSLQRNM